MSWDPGYKNPTPGSGETCPWRSASWLRLQETCCPCCTRNLQRLREDCHLLNTQDSVLLPRAPGSGACFQHSALFLFKLRAGEIHAAPTAWTLWDHLENEAVALSDLLLLRGEVTCSSHRARSP